jgi:hypothetical protein
MSHFTEIKARVLDMNAFHKVAFLRGLTTEQRQVYTNPYSGEVVKNATVVSKNGKVLMVIGADGKVTLDSFYMGQEYKNILQEYVKETVLTSAALSGGWITEETVDEKTGDLILEVQF